MKGLHPISILIISGIIFIGCFDKTKREFNDSSSSTTNSSEKMSKDSSINKLIEQLTSTDAAISEKAGISLVKQGKKAVPSLTEQLPYSDIAVKGVIMRVLAIIADSSSTSLFLASLKDQDPKVRAMAAEGLVRLKHPEAIDALIATLHDYGDETSPYTTSAYALIDYGPEALPAVVSLLSSPSLFTREMGFQILTQIITKIPKYQYKWEELNTQLGSYDPAANQAEREKAAEMWKEWLAKIPEE
jgi:hypothetical protein